MHHRLAVKTGVVYHVERWVGVETQGKYTQGMTVVIIII